VNEQNKAAALGRGTAAANNNSRANHNAAPRNGASRAVAPKPALDALPVREKDDWPYAPIDVRVAMLEPAPDIPFFVRDRLVMGRAHNLSGLGGSSKTRFLTQLAVGAIRGQVLFPWDIPEEAQGPAALLLTEDAAHETRRTLFAIARAMQLGTKQVDALAEGLHIFPLAGRDVTLLRATPEGILFRTPLYHALRKFATDHRVKFIGLDPAIRLTEGDELSSRHQRALGDAVDTLAMETGACVLLTTHARKSLGSEEEMTSHSARGAGALTDAVRAEIVMRTMTSNEAKARNIPEEERHSFVAVKVVKGNFLPPEAFAVEWLRRGEHGVLFAAEDMPAANDRRPAYNPMGDIAVKLLWDLGAGKLVQSAEWRESMVKGNLITGKNEEAQRKTFGRIVKKLTDNGLVIAHGIGRGIMYQPYQGRAVPTSEPILDGE
jgi:hypothetical protein